MAKYSLSNRIVSIEANDVSLRNVFGKVTVGGQGSMLESISIDYKDDQWTTDTFSTGGYVHNKNLSKAGTITIVLSQLSENVTKFINLVNLHYTGDYQGLTITLTDTAGGNNGAPREILTASDCYFTRIPTQEYGRTASTDSWVLTCGEISYS